jgi:hypothetical protein
VVTIGTGGSLTVSFAVPILNDPNNPYGRDFQIFGNSFFVLAPPSFTTATGAIGGNQTGNATVSVSSDGVKFYTVENPSLTPVVDGAFPTDGQGNFSLPVDPSLSPSAFAGKTLEQVRQLYNGSGGGTSFDISWATDEFGARVNLGSIQFVRIDVLSGKADIDGFAAVVPEPTTTALATLGALGLFMTGNRRKAKLK